MRQRCNASAALAVAGALAGCTTVGPDFRPPGGPTGAASQHYEMPGDPAPRDVVFAVPAELPSPWWKIFDSADIDFRVRAALERSPTVAEAEAVLAKSRAELAAERGVRFPEVSLRSQSRLARINTATFGLPGLPSRTLDLYSLGAVVTYDLDLFGPQRRKIEASKAKLDASGSRADAAKLALSGNLILQMLRISTLNAEIIEARSMVQSDRQIIAMLKEAQAAGGVARTDLSTLLTQLAEDESRLPPLERQLAFAKHQMAILSGRAPAEMEPAEIPLEAFHVHGPIPVHIPSELLRRRPDIRAAEAELHSATAAVGVAVANQYPNMRLSAELSQTALQPRDIFGGSATGWNLAAAMAGSIFNGGALSARREAAEADLLIAHARYEQTVLRAFVQVSDTLAALAADQNAIDSISDAAAASEIALQDVQTDYREGGAPLIDVVRAQRAVSLARQAKVQIEGQRLADIVELQMAVAADWRPEYNNH